MGYRNFDKIVANKDWAFEHVRSTEQWTHGYHRYPAKFLPNVVKKLIECYSTPNSVVADLFAGCGTTLVEAKVHGMQSIGTDINPVATLITRVKTTPIPPQLLNQALESVNKRIAQYECSEISNSVPHTRIDYWFRTQEKNKIAYLYKIVNDIQDVQIREFFLVTISHILKNCSWWLQSSTKPQKDPNKQIPCPFDAFNHQCAHMMRGNLQYYTQLVDSGFIDVTCQILEEDARHTSIESQSVDIIITSPPYVTSYEYADIHQLTGYWMEYFLDIAAFRKLFIGTSYSGVNEVEITSSKLGQKIIKNLYEQNKRISADVAKYFNDINAVALEMYRILKKNGVACIVIGNTTLKNVHVKSAEVFFDFLKEVGFKKVDIIKRNIPNKLMPTLRDKITGKFTTTENKNCKRVYPDEYIIIVKK